MKYDEAERRLLAGRFITLPNVWNFWFLHRGECKCFCFRNGEITNYSLGEFKNRVDWEVTNGNGNIEQVSAVLLGKNSIIKRVKRVTSKGKLVLINRRGKIFSSINDSLFREWVPTKEDFESKNYIIVDDSVLKLDEDY